MSVPTGTPETSIVGPLPYLILEVAVDDRPPLELDQLDEGTQPTAHRLQHRRRDVLPILVRLQLQDQRQLRRHHWHVLQLLEQAGDRSTIFLRKAVEPMIRAQQRKLRAKDQEIELLGVEIIIGEARRQPGDLVDQVGPDHRVVRLSQAALLAHSSRRNEPLRPDDEIVEAHRGDLVMQAAAVSLAQRPQRLVLPSLLVDLADQFDALDE